MSNAVMMQQYAELLARAEAAEATGRAAVRALANVYDCAQSGRCRRCWSAANAVLATDTARAWLKEDA